MRENGIPIPASSYKGRNPNDIPVQQPSEESGNDKRKWEKRCNYCKGKGHLEAECRKKGQAIIDRSVDRPNETGNSYADINTHDTYTVHHNYENVNANDESTHKSENDVTVNNEVHENDGDVYETISLYAVTRCVFIELDDSDMNDSFTDTASVDYQNKLYKQPCYCVRIKCKVPPDGEQTESSVRSGDGKDRQEDGLNDADDGVGVRKKEVMNCWKEITMQIDSGA